MQRNSTRFNCFSPPVMVATLLIEFGLAIYAVWRYKLTPVTRLIAIMLTALATFQLAEYFVCTGATAYSVQWSQIGFVAITTLPPLGIHLMHLLGAKPDRRLVITAYITMAGFIGFFLLRSTAFAGHVCTGNYVIFQLSEPVTNAYSLYYFGWLVTGIILGISWSDELKAADKRATTQRQTVKALILGYLVFLVPSALAMAIKPETRQAIPSVLCGFAVFLALILAMYILPRVGQGRSKSGKLDKAA